MKRFFAILFAVAALLPQPSMVSACLHGATGLEQTAIMRGGVREERLVGKWDGTSRSILKLFVGPSAAPPKISELSEVELKQHESLAQLASELAEGGPTRRGDYTTKSGVTVAAEKVTSLSWSQIAEKFGIKEPEIDPRDYDKLMEGFGTTNPEEAAKIQQQRHDSLPLWLEKIREEKRALYAVSIDMTAALKNPEAERDAYALAASFQYPAGDAGISSVLKDKWLDHWTTWNKPSIIQLNGGVGDLGNRMKDIVSADPDINDPKPVTIRLETPAHGKDGVDGDVSFSLKGKAGKEKNYTLVKVRGDIVYFEHLFNLTPRTNKTGAVDRNSARLHDAEEAQKAAKKKSLRLAGQAGRIQ